MDLKVLISDKEQFLTDIQKEKIKKICEESYILELRKIKDLAGKTFLIKDYQRGYRWTSIEIETLLNDIESIDLILSEEGYCLQPVFVKKVKGENNEYELIDGQQRLTTLKKVIDYLNQPSLKWEIKYDNERKTDDYFLQKAKSTIENWFVKKVRKNGKCEIADFCKKLEKLFFIWYEIPTKEEKDGDLSEDIFGKINRGKIELTNAELFKALLLNPDNVKDLGKDAIRKQEQIAFEWDAIETSLKDDDFWFFLCNYDCEKEKEKTRIDFVIELYASEIVMIDDELRGKFKPDKERFSFLVIQNLLSRYDDKTDAIEKIWEEIVEVFNTLYTWYKDFELFHTIGFLTSCTRQTIGSQALVSEKIKNIYFDSKNNRVGSKKRGQYQLFKDYSNEKTLNDRASTGKTLEEVRKNVRRCVFNEIFKESEVLDEDNRSRKSTLLNEVKKAVKTRNKDFLENIKYNGEGLIEDKNHLKNILLFTNIYQHLHLTNDNNLENKKDMQRFSFSKFHKEKWDIEHIRPQTFNSDISKLSEEEQQEQIKALENEEDETVKEIVKTIRESAGKEEISNKDIWKMFVENYSDEDNSIENLVLLDESTNRSYGNAFFRKKRETIIKRDHDGFFIPTCTKYVFLKYYTEFEGKAKTSNNYVWTKEDANAYGEYIAKMFFKVIEWRD